MTVDELARLRLWFDELKDRLDAIEGAGTRIGDVAAQALTLAESNTRHLIGDSGFDGLLARFESIMREIERDNPRDLHERIRTLETAHSRIEDLEQTVKDIQRERAAEEKERNKRTAYAAGAATVIATLLTQLDLIGRLAGALSP